MLLARFHRPPLGRGEERPACLKKSATLKSGGVGGKDLDGGPQEGTEGRIRKRKDVRALGRTGERTDGRTDGGTDDYCKRCQKQFIMASVANEIKNGSDMLCNIHYGMCRKRDNEWKPPLVPDMQQCVTIM